MGTADLRVKLGSLTISNPVMVASGTGGYGLELEEWIDISKIGALVVKGLSLEPRPGNPPPRTCETAAGLLNSVGLENAGVGEFVRNILPELRKSGAAVIANIYGTTIEEFLQVCRQLEESGEVAALELNLSCPNVKSGGILFGRDPRQAAAVVSAVKKRAEIPVIAKLTPNVSDITEPAKACRDAGADALSVTNTFLGLAIDIDRRRPVLGGNLGGLSGPAIKPLALRLVWETCQSVDIPVIGIGGISTWQDAVEFIIAGASAVQVGTANLFNPGVTIEIAEGIADFLVSEGIDNLYNLRGSLSFNRTD